MTSASIPDVSSTGRSGRALQCCRKMYVWQLIMLYTDGNRLGKGGLGVMGRDCGWGQVLVGGKEGSLDLSSHG